MWICYTCCSKISRGDVPANLQVDPVVAELACLNSLDVNRVPATDWAGSDDTRATPS